MTTDTHNFVANVFFLRNKVTKETLQIHPVYMFCCKEIFNCNYFSLLLFVERGENKYIIICYMFRILNINIKRTTSTIQYISRFPPPKSNNPMASKKTYWQCDPRLFIE